MSTIPWRERCLHFVGIGGAGMSGLALVAQQLGARVTGSDLTDSDYTSLLRQHGLQPALGHAAKHVPPEAEVVYSTAVADINPELVIARQRQQRIMHRADLLGELTQLKRTIAVTGTHGKTTTTALIIHLLTRCGYDPAFVVGAQLAGQSLNAGWGTGEWLVVEADESDRSLLKLSVELAVLTNAEVDHHTTYRDQADLEATLREFLAAAARAVIWNQPELLALCTGPRRAYRLPAFVPTEGGINFKWRKREATLPLYGWHNALNAVCALEVATQIGIKPVEALAALTDFAGVARRFQLVGQASCGAPIYDDYAHHPTEVAATLRAARGLRPKRLVAIFQPHLYSRTQQLAAAFGQALTAADVIVVTNIYPARELSEDYPGVSGELIADAAAKAANGRLVQWLPTFADAEQYLQDTLQAGDLCLLMGAGDIDQLGKRLVT